MSDSPLEIVRVHGTEQRTIPVHLNLKKTAIKYEHSGSSSRKIKVRKMP
jgi:hypothetical protein